MVSFDIYIYNSITKHYKTSQDKNSLLLDLYTIISIVQMSKYIGTLQLLSDKKGLNFSFLAKATKMLGSYGCCQDIQ